MRQKSSCGLSGGPASCWPRRTGTRVRRPILKIVKHSGGGDGRKASRSKRAHAPLFTLLDLTVTLALRLAGLTSSRPLPAAFAARLMPRSVHPAVRRSAPGFRPSCRLVGATATCRRGHESVGTVRAQRTRKCLNRKGERCGPLILNPVSPEPLSALDCQRGTSSSMPVRA